MLDTNSNTLYSPIKCAPLEHKYYSTAETFDLFPDAPSVSVEYFSDNCEKLQF